MSVAWLVRRRFIFEKKGPGASGPRPSDSRPEQFCDAESACFLGHRAALRRRPDVLVEAKKVGWIVLVLQGYQPLVVLAVRLSNPVFSFFSQVVDVDAAFEERLHRLEELTRPLDILF